MWRGEVGPLSIADGALPAGIRGPAVVDTPVANALQARVHWDTLAGNPSAWGKG